MKVSKKFTIFSIIAVMLLLVVLPFCAPAKTKAEAASAYRGDYILISVENQADGKVAWALEFGLNTQKRNLADENEKALYRVQIQTMLQKVYQEKREEIENIYALNPTEQFKPADNITLTTPIYDQKADCVNFKFFFKNAEVYNFYNAKETDQRKADKNIFYQQQIVSTVFPFAEVMQTPLGEMNLARYYLNLYITACSGLSIADKMQNYDPEFIFDYATPSKKIKTNAEIQYTDAVGLYHHAWGERFASINPSFVTTRSLLQPNRGVWYAFGIGLPLVGMGVAIAVIKIKDKVNKSKTKQVEEI
ncbi:MAG: hypothetical protein J6C53_00815 [Clostridia bacterium]|nr:hypothetical protein [Clostridia bacterium]